MTDSQGNQEYNKAGNGDQVYSVIVPPSEVFAKRGGQPYYAKTKYQKEIYPTIKGKQVAIPGPADKYYAKDELDNQYYPKDEDGVEQPHDDSGKVTYARTKDGEEFYPKDQEESEFVEDDQYIINKDGTIKYPVDVNGHPIYPFDAVDHQYYLFANGAMQIGKSTSGTPVYAKQKTSSGAWDEYYPSDGQIGYLLTGEPIYAETSTGQLIFPTDSANNEFYLKHKNTQADSLHSAGRKIHRYARDNQGNEFYPKNKKELVLDNRYAELKSTLVIYPLDENGNEYILYDDKKRDKDNFPLGYPITNDEFVIVPKIDGRQYVSKNIFPKVNPANIIGMLYREGEGYSDYVTNVRSGRSSRSTVKPIYKVLPIPPLAAQPPAAQPPAAQPGNPAVGPGNPPAQPGIPAVRLPVPSNITNSAYMNTISISVAVVFGVIVMMLLLGACAVRFRPRAGGSLPNPQHDS